MKIDVSPGDGRPSWMVLGGLFGLETLLPEGLWNCKAGSEMQQPKVGCRSLVYKLVFWWLVRKDTQRISKTLRPQLQLLLPQRTRLEALKFAVAWLTGR